MSKKNARQKKNTVTLVIILIAAACVGLFFGIKILPSVMGNSENGNVYTAGDSVPDDETFQYVTYNGKKYKYNDHLTNILLMGIDKTTEEAYDEAEKTAGRSDVLYLIAMDRQTGDYTQIKIPRDTMTSIHFIGKDGSDQGWQEDHISLAYYFGDGKYESCELTRDAVSKLFYNVPIRKYAALSLDCIDALAKTAGEVTVKVPNDSLEEKHPEFKKGETVVLTPENTENFVRSRDTEKSQSAVARSERQDAYLKAYKSLARTRSNEDPHFLTEIYEAVKPYMVTNMDNGEFVDMLEAAVTDADSQSLTLPGEGVSGTDEIYDQYIVDQDALYDLIINTFYVEVKDQT